VSGSATVLGDQAQATTPWAVGDWHRVLEHLGKPDGTVQALTLGYRVPRDVLDLANRLLPLIAPALPPASSLRHVVGAVSFSPTVAEAVDRLRGKGSVAVVVPDVLTEDIPDAVPLGDEGLSAPVTVVRAAEVKGLEFDHVVLVDPDALPLRVLYVAMTRAVTSLTVVGQLPTELA
jgi:DNA helicase IV